MSSNGEVELRGPNDYQSIWNRRKWKKGRRNEANTCGTNEMMHDRVFFFMRQDINLFFIKGIY
jgi:hypothetical protein